MLKGMGHKACNMFGSLPAHVRAGLSALMAGTLFLALCALVFHIGRRGRISREERKARRQQRKDARRAAKAAYKATKAARSSKEAEAGFALAQDASEAEREALPSYKDNETDALIERQ
jgi:predicted lipid-binding transport protein (Tim44 family)